MRRARGSRKLPLPPYTSMSQRGSATKCPREVVQERVAVRIGFELEGDRQARVGGALLAGDRHGADLERLLRHDPFGLIGGLPADYDADLLPGLRQLVRGPQRRTRT